MSLPPPDLAVKVILINHPSVFYDSTSLFQLLCSGPWISIIMPRTRRQDAVAAEKEPTTDSHQQEEPSQNPPAASAPTDEKKDEGDDDDAAARARERKERFKALQARAVSD